MQLNLTGLQFRLSRREWFETYRTAPCRRLPSMLVPTITLDPSLGMLSIFDGRIDRIHGVCDPYLLAIVVSKLSDADHQEVPSHTLNSVHPSGFRHSSLHPVNLKGPVRDRKCITKWQVSFRQCKRGFAPREGYQSDGPTWLIGSNRGSEVGP